jgi:histidine decarboxylase
MVTHSGTDGNMHAMYFGVKYLQAKTKQLPIVYVSQEAHYSIKKLTDLQNLELRIIPTLPMGQMDVAALEKAIYPARPALVVAAIGTTFKGAVDDQQAIAAALRRAKPPAVYTMLDAALFGGYLPFSPFRDLINRQKLPFDAIAVSGHKFFGFDEPLGLFITTKEVFDSQNPFQVPYLSDAVPTITCSRSALGALKFWWQMTRNGEKEYARQAEQILKAAQYQKQRLDEMNYPAWLNPMSNTVFFKRPAAWIMKKWDLAPDHDPRLGGDLAHEILMQHETRETIEAFIDDLKKSL